MSVSPELLEYALKLLPHGPEFRFVDRMLSLTCGKEGVGEYRVREENCPANDQFPAMLLVECGAQVAGIVVQEDLFNPNWPRMKLTALRKVEISGTPRAGDVLRIEAVITGRLGVLVQAAVSGTLNDEKILAAELTLSGTDAVAQKS
jgi:3-hydroxyacyl-[acyl-carrier-protein] dehydratase